MRLSWTNKSLAFQYAFNLNEGPLAKRVVLLHKDRLNEIATLLSNAIKFKGRWKGIRTIDCQIAFVAVPNGASDVCDCLLHLSAYPPSELIFTGTCGGISKEVKIGSTCIMTEGWLPIGDFLEWIEDPDILIKDSKLVKSSHKMNHEIINEKIIARHKLAPLIVRSLSVPFQAIESLPFINAVQKLGADVVDMESAIFLSIAEKLNIPALCLMWCTDQPEDISYYSDVDESIKTIRHQTWVKWPDLLVECLIQ